MTRFFDGIEVADPGRASSPNGDLPRRPRPPTEHVSVYGAVAPEPEYCHDYRPCDFVPENGVLAQEVTVLGVDDFAIRRGQTYGTVLIDCEGGRVVDLLPGRDAAPLAAWLAEHAKPKVICRDRASAYAEGARTGAPDAVQVADRFHLWQNLAKAVERCAARHKSCLSEPVTTPVGDLLGETKEAASTGAMAQRRREHHKLVHDLLAEGAGLRQIARHLGWGRHTVQRYARAVTWQEMFVGQKPRSSSLDRFKPYLLQRISEGCLKATTLYREATAQGFTGSYSIVRSFAEQHRTCPDLGVVTKPPSVPW